MFFPYLPFFNFTWNCIYWQYNGSQFPSTLYIPVFMYYICTGTCFTYLIMTLFSLSDLLTVGHSCLSDMQCTGTEFASVCNNRQCECQSRYILNGTKCYPGN